jgi:hypothetical protein
MLLVPASGRIVVVVVMRSNESPRDPAEWLIEGEATR